MKRSSLWEGILFILGGAALLCVALLTDSVLDSLLVGLAAGAICSGCVTTCKYFYWTRPQNQERYQERLAKEAIELHDELKTMLRDKSGRYAYVAGLLVTSIAIVVFSVLGKSGAVSQARPMVLYLSGYLVFQFVIGVVIFRRLLKKYE